MKRLYLLYLLSFGAALCCTGCSGGENSNAVTPTPSAPLSPEQQQGAAAAQEMGRKQAEAMQKSQQR